MVGPLIPPLFIEMIRFQFILVLLFPKPVYLIRRYRHLPVWLWPMFYVNRWFEVFRDFLFSLLKVQV